MTLPEMTIERETHAVESDQLDPMGSAAYGRRTFRQRMRRIPWHVAVFILPAFVVYTTFMVYPLLDSLRLSLFDDAGKFVGLDNFHTLFFDETFSKPFWGALEHNVVFFAFHSLVQNPIALLLALLLTVQGVRGQQIYRTLIFLPTVLSVV